MGALGIRRLFFFSFFLRLQRELSWGFPLHLLLLLLLQDTEEDGFYHVRAGEGMRAEEKERERERLSQAE